MIGKNEKELSVLHGNGCKDVAKPGWLDDSMDKPSTRSPH